MRSSKVSEYNHSRLNEKRLQSTGIFKSFESLSSQPCFIIDLEQREEAAFPSPYIATDRSLGITATGWAAEILQKINDKGIANVAAATMRQLEAKERGESREAEYMQFPGRWI